MDENGPLGDTAKSESEPKIEAHECVAIEPGAHPIQPGTSLTIPWPHGVRVDGEEVPLGGVFGLMVSDADGFEAKVRCALSKLSFSMAHGTTMQMATITVLGKP